MRVNIDRLMVFLNENAESDEAKALVAEQEPLLRRVAGIVESGGWPLAVNPSWVYLDQLAADVAALTGMPGLRCVAVCASYLLPNRECISEDECLTCLRIFGGSLSSRLWASLVADLRGNLRPGLREISLWSILGNLQEIGENPWSVLFFCLGFAIAGDLERTERLSRIVEAFADGVMPIGFKADKPDALLFVHA